MQIATKVSIVFLFVFCNFIGLSFGCRIAMNKRSNCPIACALDLVGDKWTLLVLRDMVVFNKSRFEEFLESAERISTNILTDRLHKLEGCGLIEKEPYSSHRYRMSYTPTEKGKSMAVILQHLSAWGLENIQGTVHAAPVSWD